MEQVVPTRDIAAAPAVPEWWPHVILGVASALLLTLLVVTLYYATTARRLLTDLQQYAWQVDKVDALLIQLLNAETGARGFLVTADNVYLDRYREGISRLGALLSDIDSHPEKPPLNVDEYGKLKRLIDAEIKALSSAIDARQAGARLPDKLIEHGNRMMDAIRDSLNRIRSQLSQDNATYYVTSLGFLGKSRWVVVSLFTAAFLLLLSLFLLLQKQIGLRHRIASMMSDENERLEKLVKQRTTELNDLASYLTRLSETEKRRIAQELHDEMGALLTAARMDTTWIMRDLDPRLSEKYARRLSRLSESLDAAISLKRKITSDLKPPLLQELGLIESVSVMVQDLANDGSHQVRMELPKSLPPIDSERTLAVFRIIQESLTNIRKYAQARHIEVGVSLEDQDIHIRIADDGQGFDSDRQRSAGNGIPGMRHRAQMFGGGLTVTSSPGQGTLIEAYIPIQGRAERRQAQ